MQDVKNGRTFVTDFEQIISVHVLLLSCRVVYSFQKCIIELSKVVNGLLEMVYYMISFHVERVLQAIFLKRIFHYLISVEYLINLLLLYRNCNRVLQCLQCIVRFVR